MTSQRHDENFLLGEINAYFDKDSRELEFDDGWTQTQLPYDKIPDEAAGRVNLHLAIKLERRMLSIVEANDTSVLNSRLSILTLKVLPAQELNKNRNLIQQTWKLIQCTSVQMHEGIMKELDVHFGSSPLEWKESHWLDMSSETKLESLRNVTRSWAMMFCLMPVLVRQHYGKEPLFDTLLLEVVRTFWSHGQDRDLVTPLLAFFVDLAALFDKFAYVLRRQEVNIRLATILATPTRHAFLTKLARSAPPTSSLLISIDGILHALPKDERSCTICTASWEDKEELEKIAWAVYGRRYKWGTNWLTLDTHQRTMVIAEGFENVPLWIGCGHVFCAGCVKHWLDSSDARLQCPFRDLDFGFQGGEAVSRIEEVIMEYHGWC